MSYLIYLKRSYQYRLRSHMALYVILTSAMILPLIFSIFRDSILFGQASFVQDYTRGCEYHVMNAKQEYLDYFKDIPGISSYYEDNKIYIDMIGTDGKDTSMREIEISQRLLHAMDEISDEQVSLFYVSEFGEDESNDLFGNQLFFVNGIIMVISLFIIQSAYKSYFNKFLSDVGVLVSYGADNKQMQTLFLIDVLILFVVSTFSAVALSVALMYGLFYNFLQVKEIGNLSWIIFHINPYSVGIQVVFFGFVLLAIVKLLLSKNLKQASITMVRTDRSGTNKKYKGKTFKIKENSVESLTNLLFQRTKSQVMSCLVITVPITIIVLFIFNYIIININNIGQKPDYEILIHKEGSMLDRTGISTSDVEIINGMEEIEYVKEELNISPTKYLVKDQRMKGPSMVAYGDYRYGMTAIQSYHTISDELKEKEFNRDKYNVAVSKNHKYLKYKVGDKIYLYLNGIHLTEIQTGHNKDIAGSDEEHNRGVDKVSFTPNQIELTVVQLLDNEWTDRMLPIYFTDELYQELTDGEAVERLRLKLKDSNESKAVESILNSKIKASDYTITNEQAMYEKSKDTSMGIYILALFIFGIMFAFILMILYVKLTDYIEGQSENIQIFSILGASESDIYGSYMRLPIYVSAISIVVSYTVGLGLCILFFANTGYYLIGNITTISIHVIIAMLILAAFNVPVHVTLKNKLKLL